MSDRLRVVALARTSDVGPSTRYRILQYRERLAADGIVVDVRPLFGATWFALLDLRVPLVTPLLKGAYALARLAVRLGQLAAARASSADVILVEQQLFPYLPAWVEVALWPRGRATILEFDDAIFLTPGHGAKLRALCGLATRTIVGNETLAEFARAATPRVDVIPTTLDVSAYQPVARVIPHPAALARPGSSLPDLDESTDSTAVRGLAHDAIDTAPHESTSTTDCHRPRERHVRAPGEPFRVAWIGLPYNLHYLDVLAAPLRALAVEGPVELRVISRGRVPGGEAWRGVDVVARPWSAATEADELAACHVGVMPLPDTPWTRGKCGLKLLQCMAAGLPVVASPVGVNTEIVEHGVDGLLARDEAEWTSALRSLRDDPDRASALATAGRRTVETSYSVATGAHLVAAAYRRAADAHRSSAPARAP